MTNLSNRQFSILEKVAGTRAVMSVLKRVQEARPDDSPSHVWRFTRLAMSEKLSKLLKKPFASLSANQVATMRALEVADTLLIGFGSIFGDDETTRALDPDERDALVEMSEKRKAAAKKSAEARKAKKAATTAPATAELFAKA